MSQSTFSLSSLREKVSRGNPESSRILRINGDSKSYVRELLSHVKLVLLSEVEKKELDRVLTFNPWDKSKTETIAKYNPIGKPEVTFCFRRKLNDALDDIELTVSQFYAVSTLVLIHHPQATINIPSSE